MVIVSKLSYVEKFLVCALIIPDSVLLSQCEVSLQFTLIFILPDIHAYYQRVQSVTEVK